MFFGLVIQLNWSFLIKCFAFMGFCPIIFHFGCHTNFTMLYKKTPLSSILQWFLLSEQVCKLHMAKHMSCSIYKSNRNIKKLNFKHLLYIRLHIISCSIYLSGVSPWWKKHVTLIHITESYLRMSAFKLHLILNCHQWFNPTHVPLVLLFTRKVSDKLLPLITRFT